MKSLFVCVGAALVVGSTFAAEMEKSTPEAEGISSAAIGAWIDACERELDAVHGFVLVRHGKTIAEGWWSPFSADRTHMLYSHSKSFTSTAVGLLADDGKLDLDEHIVDILPDKAPTNATGRVTDLRVRDLLTMTTGMPYTDAERKDFPGDWVKLFLANEIKDLPGTTYRYDSCATHVLAAIVERKSGQKLMDFLKARLFDPIGITQAWTTTNPQGIACGGWGMNMTTRELARFGQLYLQQGRWGDRQVISTNWVRLATSYQTSTQRPGNGDWSQGYGYQFWRCRHNCFRADGAFGQYTIVMPEQDAVLSIHAGLGPMHKELDLVWQYLLPAMQAKALPADVAAQRALADRCAKLALKTVQGEKTGTATLGKTYQLVGEQKRFNFKTVQLSATADGWEIVLTNALGEQRIPVGYQCWREGSVRFENEPYEKLGGLIGDQPTAASGAWTAPNVFKARIYFHNGTFRLDDTFTFNPDGSLELDSNLFGMGGGKWKMTGKPAGEFTLGFDKARPYEKGFTRVGDEIVIDNGDDATRRAGACWGLRLDQKEALPFTVRTEACCEKGPGGGRTREFALYLDISYMDGDHLWGQVADFAPDPKRGWRAGAVTVIPEKPVRGASVYCLYRGLPGRVRFRLPTVKLRETSDLVAFDGQCLPAANLPKSEPGFLLRDVAVDEDTFAPIVPGAGAKGVKLIVDEQRSGADSYFKVKVEDAAGRDRAVTLIYAVPLPAGELVYEQDPRTSVALKPTDSQRSDARGMGCGAGGLNRWPFGAVTVGGTGVALGIDTARPAYFRTIVHPRSRLLFIAFDLGLSPEKRTAEFAFRKFAFQGGFRGALAKYATLEKSAFTTRVPEQGIWMPFHSIKSVENWQDFGFKFKEGNGETAWDDAHGIFTFRYTEPSTWWLSMDKKHGTNVFTMADCVAKAEALAQTGHPWALAWRETVMRDEDGERVGSVKDEPWCRGAIWLLSPLPGIVGPSEYAVKNTEKDFAEFQEKSFPQGRDGEYIDSAEGYLTPALDFNRKVFAASETPLVFSTGEAPRPAVFKGLSMYEYVRRTANRVWPRGRFMMANGVPGRWPWLPAYVDVGGTETAWIDRDGNWRPEAHTSLIYKRAMSMGKPYCYLQNVNFEKFKYADMENFMRHCVAYGFFPGCFSHNASEGHYFSRPEIYNRDRPLFKKYVPLCKRLSEAGWRPVNTLVASADEKVFVEQFGDRYVTVFNATGKKVTARLSAKAGVQADELVEGGSVAFAADGTLEMELEPDAVQVLDVGKVR